MEAISEIGLGKAINFLIYTFLYSAYRVIIFPPVRALYLRMLGGNIGKNTVIMGVKFFNWHQNGFSNLKIGDKCFIGDETLIDLYGGVLLKNNVTIAQRVTVISHINVGYSDHPLQKIFKKGSARVTFEDGCVVGACSTILPGINIGKNSFVAAGSIVNEDVPNNCLVAGVPAKVVRRLN